MLTTYRVVSFTVFAAFSVFVLDVRNNPGMAPIVNRGFTALMKISAVAMLVLYAATAPA